MRRIIAAVAAIAIYGMAAAQHMHFFTSDSHLSSTLINKTLYDSNGFLWVATEDGLNRFDGSRFKIYRNEPSDSTSLSDNFVTSVFEDNDKNLLVCTYAGVQIYNASTDSFYPIDSKSSEDRGYSVSDIVITSDGRLLFGGRVLAEAVVPSNKVVRYKNIIYSEPGLQIKKLVADLDGSVWLTSNIHGGLTKVEKDGKTKHYFDYPDAPEPLSACVTPTGEVFVGTQEGELLQLDPATDKFETVGSIWAPISTLLTSDAGILLIGTDWTGMASYNPSHPEEGLMALDLMGEGSLPQKVHSLDYDEYGNLWVGLYQKGLVMVPKQTNTFNTLGRETLQAKLIGEACVTAVYVDERDNLWVGTDFDGAYCVSPDRMHSVHFSPQKSFPAVINKFYTDAKGKLWVASYDKGLGIVDPATGSYKRIDIRDGQGRQLSHIFDMIEGADGEMYIATMGNGLYKLDHNGNVGPFKTQDGYNPWITCLERDETSGRIYFGSYDGLFEAEGSRIRHLVPGQIITSILMDAKSKTLWIGTNHGLMSVNPRNGNHERIEGLVGSIVHAVEKRGTNLWVSTNSGIFRYDPQTGAAVNYNYNDGLQGNEFYKGASCSDGKGNLYFGGIKGVTYFNPDKISGFSTPTALRLSRFYVGGEEIKAGVKASGSTPVTDKAVFETDTFRLSPSDNSFSLDFNVSDPFTHAAPAFYYSLDGSEWQQIPSQNASTYSQGARLSFSHLPAGDHRLLLKAVDKGAESQVKSLLITIAPAWYSTWWARALYIFLALGLAGAVIMYFRQRQKQRILEMQHRHEEEVKEGKLQFFTNVSHEIKTPMSLVIGPVEQLIAEDKDPGRQQTYNIILRNSNRILRLVNEIMDLRKIDKNKMSMQMSRVKMVGFIEDLYHTFEPAAKKNQIELTFTHKGCDDLEADIDIENFDKVAMNLLSNAIKYTPKGGKVEISLEADPAGKTGAKARLIVTDTGVGVAEKDREHIFDRFYRVADNYASGTGIGLHLASRLMHLHGGKLWVEDNPAGQGSRFIAEWPLRSENAERAETPAKAERQATKPAYKDLGVPEDYETEGASKRRTHLVYIVEDDKEIASYIAGQLASDYRVETFGNGREALEAIHKEAPGLVISDVMMPEMDGLTLTRKIRDNININHIPVILLTAKTRESDVMEGLDSGADDYVQKPFSVSILKKKVRSLLSAHDRLKNVYSGQQDQSEKVEAPVVKSHDDQLLDRVLKVVNANLGNSEITIETIAQEIGISRVHLHRKLKAITNQTTRDFVRNIRLQKAAEIMQSAKLNVSEVSIMVGFKSANSFATVFKEMYGMTPSEYMAKHHDNR
ncbi:MAG: response regulator [Clostridium sp.]|nr:response regulator [Clostridium sp.]